MFISGSPSYYVLAYSIIYYFTKVTELLCVTCIDTNLILPGSPSPLFPLFFPFVSSSSSSLVGDWTLHPHTPLFWLHLSHGGWVLAAHSNNRLLCYLFLHKAYLCCRQTRLILFSLSLSLSIVWSMHLFHPIVANFKGFASPPGASVPCVQWVAVIGGEKGAWKRRGAAGEGPTPSSAPRRPPI